MSKIDSNTFITTNQHLRKWREDEKKVLSLIQITGELRLDHSIELVLFRRKIYDTPTSVILNHHQYASRYSETSLSIDDTLCVARALKECNLAPCKIDLGKLAVAYKRPNNSSDVKSFIRQELGNIIDTSPKNDPPKDVVLYGFGRIGRLVTRILIQETGKGEQLRLKAIVIRPKLKDAYAEVKKRMALLSSDSVHGDFGGIIEIAEDGKSVVINGNKIFIICAKDPVDVNYIEYGIKNALVIDNTGVWRSREGLSQHLRDGIDQVLLTAPSKDDIPNIVYGVNHESLAMDSEQIYSAASCTTNAIAPVLEVMLNNFGIEKGHIETIHAYTNDQNLLDNFHKKPRRGRGAPINMVLTTTGAASAVTKVNPAFRGKLTGNAIRVPTPNVSLAILNLTLEKSVSRGALNQLLKDVASNGALVEQIHYSDSTEYVSSNAIGMTTTSVVDAPSTIVSEDGQSVTIYLWYDNEYGYSCQVMRLAKHIAGVRRYVYY